VRLRLDLSIARSSAEGDPVAMRKAARLSVLLDRCERYKKPVLPLTGADVLAAGIPAGKRVGEILSTLETLWVERNFSLDRATLAARLEEMVREEPGRGD